MVIGSGDIASVLPARDDLLFFASGVSNSQEVRIMEYQREIDLLKAQDTNAHIVYFSSLAVFYADTRYTQHKRYMEQLIKQTFPRYCIVRLGNITWGTNPHTLINYLHNRVVQGLPVKLQDEYRYVIDKDEFLHWMNLIPEWSCELNTPGRRMKVKEIFDEYCGLYTKQV